MSFQVEARKIRDESLPIGLRYISLRHCVEAFCPLGFNNTWQRLEERFGVNDRGSNTSESLICAIQFLEAWRKADLEYRIAQRKYKSFLIKSGLPKNL